MYNRFIDGKYPALDTVLMPQVLSDHCRPFTF